VLLVRTPALPSPPPSPELSSSVEWLDSKDMDEVVAECAADCEKERDREVADECTVDRELLSELTSENFMDLGEYAATISVPPSPNTPNEVSVSSSSSASV
jgi:hypothetical protein